MRDNRQSSNASRDGMTYNEGTSTTAGRPPLTRRPVPPTEPPPLERRHIRGKQPDLSPKTSETTLAAAPLREKRQSRPNPEKTRRENPTTTSAMTRTVAIPGVMERLRYRTVNPSAVRAGDVIRAKGGVDRAMLVLTILLMCVGTIMVFTASYAEALSRHGDSFRFIRPQIGFVAMGMAAMVVLMHIDYRIFKKFSMHVFVASMGLLFLVLIFGLAEGQAMRWLRIGPITFQPSEVMKLGIVMFLANYYYKYTQRVQSIKFWESSSYGVFIPAFVLGVVCVLIMMQNHFSGTIIMMMIGVSVIWASGARKFWLVAATVAALVGIVIIIMTVPYARVRITSWLNPENYDLNNELWQAHQGRLAIGSGGIFGVGIGNSRQKHMFVPEPQNDFIFTIIAEELGFVGAMLILGLYLAFIWRGLIIARKAPDAFSSLLVYGIIMKVAIQTTLNIAVVTGVAPNTGVSLPFASYGGSALVMLLAEMGIVLSVSRYSFQNK